MPGLGTLVNCAAVIAGGVLGLLFGKKINTDVRDSLMKAAGVAVIFLGLSGTLSEILKVSPEDGTTLTTYGALMMIVSLIIGTLTGELIKIEDKLDRFGQWLKKKNESRGGRRLRRRIRKHLTYNMRGRYGCCRCHRRRNRQ